MNLIDVQMDDGTLVKGVPEGTTKSEIQRRLQNAPQQTSAPPQQTVAEDPLMSAIMQPDAPQQPETHGLEQFAIGMREGVSGLAGLPMDAINALPMAANVVNHIPYTDFNVDVGPIDPNGLPGGSKEIEDLIFDKILGIPKPDAQTAGQRISRRVGTEVGASALPVAGMYNKAKSMPIEQIREAVTNAPGAISRMFNKGIESIAVAPGRKLADEGATAIAAGGGAGVANEVFSNGEQDGDNFWSDLLGSIAGVATKGAATTGGNVAKSVYGAAKGDPRYTEEVVGEAVSDRLLNNSTDAATQYAKTGELDTREIVDVLRGQAPIEKEVAGYTANTADRLQDPGLAAMTFSSDAANPGQSVVRRAGNAKAVDSRMTELAPEGNAGQLRADLEAGRASQIDEASRKASEAEGLFGDASAAAQPSVAEGSARGGLMRAALQDASDKTRAGVQELWAPLNQADDAIDIAPLNESMQGFDKSLDVNSQQRFASPESSTLAELAKDPQAMKEVMGLRAGMASDLRALESGGLGGEANARILRERLKLVDDFVETNVPAGLEGQYSAARAGTRDMKDRFARSGTAISDSLRKQDGGVYALDDSAVTSKFTPTDQGATSDFRAAMKEVGDDPRAQTALADELLSDVGRRNLLDKPDALARYLDERNIVLSEFPEVRDKLEMAGVTSIVKKSSTGAADETTKRLTTPGKSATASYLKYGDERTVDAMQTVISSNKPREAVTELLETAGRTPETLGNARSAFWEAVKKKGKNSATDVGGTTVWNGRKLREFLNDPSTRSVAEELYADKPEELANLDRMFEALASSESSIKAKAAGSSGSAQGVRAKFDAAISSSSIASRVRSVNRGQLSPTIAVIDVASTMLRRRSAQVRSKAIDDMTSRALNDPEFAADLLEAYNPANWAAKRRSLARKYGQGVTQILNLVDEGEMDDDERDMRSAIEMKPTEDKDPKNWVDEDELKGAITR